MEDSQPALEHCHWARLWHLGHPVTDRILVEMDDRPIEPLAERLHFYESTEDAMAALACERWHETGHTNMMEQGELVAVVHFYERERP